MFKPSPLQLYVHIPFCVHKCHYCDFNSHERIQPDWAAYRGALIEELKYWSCASQFSSHKLHSLFFGGGTPSLAPPDLIASIIDTAHNCFGLEKQAEITLEANPGTADTDHFLAYRQAGVNRLSMGVQSLDATELQWLERIHGADEAIEAFHIARHAGFNNINLDLMYGLPGQSLHDWLRTLHQAIELAPEHLSCYQLTVEPHTKLAASHAQKPYPLPDDETALSMFFETRRHLSEAGYEAYEISNFCKSGLKCRHNDGYWLYHDYVGIGAGASGKWDNPDGGISRYSNLRTPERYIETVRSGKKAINTLESLDLYQAAAEAFWLGLRRKRGIDRHAFQQRFSFDAWNQFRPRLQAWKDSGKLLVNADRIELSESGIALTDTISASVL